MLEKINNRVSIITAGWNGRDFVHRALDSVLAQTHTNIQYIYVDDGSTDGTQAIVLSYEDRFKSAGIEFRYVRQKNGGISAAINTGLPYADGEFLCFLEYDDMLTPDSVEKKLRFLLANPDVAVVTSDGIAVRESDPTKALGFLSHKNPNRFDENHFTALLQGELHTVIYAACHMIRMSAFDATHPGRRIYPSRKGPNIQILLPLYYRYKRGFIDEPLMYYVVRNQSISHSWARTAEAGYKTVREIHTIYDRTLDEIEMPEIKRREYKKFIRLKYAHLYLQAAPAIKNKKLGQEEYRLLKEHHAVTVRDRINYLRLRCPWTEPVFPVLKKLKRTLKRGSQSF